MAKWQEVLEDHDPKWTWHIEEKRKEEEGKERGYLNDSVISEQREENSICFPFKGTGLALVYRTHSRRGK